MKKKLVSLALLATVGVSLGGCVQSAKNEFIKNIDSVNNTQYNNVKADVSISDIEMEGATSNPVTNMIITQFKATKMSLDTVEDSKNKDLLETKLKLDVMGMSIPIDMISSSSDKPKVYLATDGLSSILEIAQSFSDEAAVIDKETLESLKGKYIDLSDLSDTTSKAESLDEASKEIALNEKFKQAYSKEVTAYLKDLDNKKFERKDNKISHTFTFKEIKDLIDLRAKVIKSDKEFSDLDSSLGNDLTKKFSDLSFKVTADTKNDSFKVDILVKPTEKEAKDSGIKSLKMKSNINYKKVDKTIKLPNKEKIVSSEELSKVISANNQETVNISDEEFDEFIKNIEILNQQGTLDDETKKELLDGYKTIFTEEQYKRLEEAMK